MRRRGRAGGERGPGRYRRRGSRAHADGKGVERVHEGVDKAVEPAADAQIQHAVCDKLRALRLKERDDGPGAELHDGDDEERDKLYLSFLLGAREIQ